MGSISTQYYEGLAQELMAKLGRLNHFVSHRPSIGNYHEAILKSVLRPIIPNRFSIRTGFTFSGDPSLSRQFDILIIDEPSSYFFKEGDFVVVHPDCVACAIEVKTKLNKQEFISASENIYSLKLSAEKSKLKYYPPGVIFAFDGCKFTEKSLHNWYKAINIPHKFAYYPDIIFCLTQGRIDHVQKQMSPMPEGIRITLGENIKGPRIQSLSVFLAYIRRFLGAKSNKLGNPFEYAEIDNLKWSAQSFRYGEGLIFKNGKVAVF